MIGSVLYNFDNKFIFIVIGVICLLELLLTIRCQEIYPIFISITLGHLFSITWQAKVIGFDVFMHKLADLVELQQCSNWLWLCYQISIDQFVSMVSLIWSQMKLGTYW